MIDRDCSDTGLTLHDYVSGRLSESRRAAVDAHLSTCERCRAALAEERIVAGVLAERVPRPRASESLRAKIATDLRREQPTRTGRSRVEAAGILAALAASVFVVFLFVREARLGPDPLVTEAVNDHLRVLYAEHPVEVESGGIHQVKPWFSGRVDFAPPLTFSGDDEFPLVGGSVAVFVDRKAAAFVFKRRLHTISVFAFRAEGLALPAADAATIRAGKLTATSLRGFHVLLFRSGDLGYALVSDVDATELSRLAGKLGI